MQQLTRRNGLILLFISMQLCSITASAAETPPSPNQDLINKKERLLLEKEIAAAEADIEKLRYPQGTAEPKAGTVGADNIGQAGQIISIDLAGRVARDFCNELPTDKKIIVNETNLMQGLVAARVLEKQINIIERALTANIPTPPRTPADAADVGVLSGITGSIKAIADLTALFRTDRTFVATTLGDGRAIFKTWMAVHCKDKLATLGDGYMGDLNLTSLDSLQGSIREIERKRDLLQKKIEPLAQKVKPTASKDGKKLGSQPIVTPTRTEIDDLNRMEEVAKITDSFILAIKPNDLSSAGPLYQAARYLEYNKRFAIGARILDLEVKVEGIKLTKSNMFTGTKLGVSGLVVVHYRLIEEDGAIYKANVLRRIAEPVEIGISTGRLAENFWSGSNEN